MPPAACSTTPRPAWAISPGSVSGMKRYHLTTFGCQMNEHDSERMKGMLESLGYDEAPAPDEADLILFNTCSIREAADNRFIAHLGEARRLKREAPDRIVGVGAVVRLAVAERLEHALHPLRVVLVHLAAERRHVVAHRHLPETVEGEAQRCSRIALRSPSRISCARRIRSSMSSCSAWM